ncbi:MAG: glycosyltransferase family 4 protein [Pseudobdellovibrio sp.]
MTQTNAKIYHIFNSSLISGPETLVMPALVKIKHQAEIVLLKESRVDEKKQKHVIEYIESLGLSYTVIPVNSRYDVEAINKISHFLEVNPHLEVAHAHDVKPSFYLLQAALKIKNRKFSIVSTHHGVHARSGFVNKLYAFYYERFVLPKFDLTLAMSSSDKRVLLSRGLSDEKTKVHLNGVTRTKISLEDRKRKQGSIRNSWGIKDSENVFLFGVAARLAEEKRHSLILDVASIMKDQHPEFKFKILCFGRGELESMLQEKTDKLNLQNEVLWMGYRAGLTEEFCGFDTLLSLSKAEGLPINLIEAAWAATPVFATRVDGVGDLMPSESLGGLVEVDESVAVVAQKILKFVESKEKLEQVGIAFQEHVEKNFSQERWLNDLLNIYSDLKIGKRS